MPTGNAQRLMSVRVKVVIIEDSVAPQRGPLVSRKQRFECAGIVPRRIELQPVEQHGKTAVRRGAVVFEIQGLHAGIFGIHERHDAHPGGHRFTFEPVGCCEVPAGRRVNIPLKLSRHVPSPDTYR